MAGALLLSIATLHDILATTGEGTMTSKGLPAEFEELVTLQH
jgi:hypothetical protein